MNRRHSVILQWIWLLCLFALLAQPQGSAYAAANLTVTPLTWNIIGLDSNNVNVGPNHFPVGARVCNTGDAIASNVKSSFVWDSSDAFINLRPGTFSSYTSNGINLGPGACTDFYYEVEVTRNSSAYNHTRRYHITATADGGLTGSTPTPRELFVERLVSQSRNTVSDVRLDGVSIPNGGTMSLIVGNTYTIQLVGSTATNGYEQIESFINFPNTIFQILSVATTYSAESSSAMVPPYDRLYGDACEWENDVNSPNYRACNGVGKAGGNITVTYQISILQAPSAPLVNPQPLSTLIYDFSGSSYHYNADYGTSTRSAYIFDPSAITISKNFNPDPTTVSGISALTFTLTNPTPVAVSGLNFTDTLPTSPGAMVVANPTNASTTGCGSPTFAPTAGAASLFFSNGTIAANGTCTIKVNVTVPVTGTYNNTSRNLFINSLDTGNNASDSLTVNSTPPGPAPVCGLNMAQWTFAGFTTNPPPFPAANTQASNVATAAISVGNGITAEADTTTSGGNPQPGIRLYGWQKDPPIATATSGYIQFAIDTSNYTQVNLQFAAQRKSNGPNNDELFFSTNGTTWTSKSTFTSTTTWTTFGAYDFTGQTSTTGTTYFRIYGYGANATSSGNDLNFDNVTFTGCATPVPPTITKAFSPDPIAVNGISTLTFTLSNSNSIDLTGVNFTDTLPTGLAVASTPSATTTCGGSPTWAPSAGATTLTFGSPTGGTISANSSCTASVNVTGTASGAYQNVSGFISSTNGGTNSGSTGSATASLTVLQPPSITKLFSPNPILTGGTSTLTFTISNPNQNNALSGVQFSDTFPSSPSQMQVAATPNATTSGCGSPTFVPAAAATSITFTNGTIAAGGACIVSVNVTAPSAGSYLNTSGAVSSTNGGTGNTASNTLTVESPSPSIALLKQISTSSTGPWRSYLTVTPVTNVYYQFTVENTGDVAFSPISVTDPTVSAAGCTWPATLSVAVSGNDNHIATCVVGPIAVTSGNHINTATASGTYSGTPYTSTSSSARYSTPAISLVKSVTETSFTLVGDVLHYSYLVTNSGFAPLLGPVSVADDKAFVSCPDVSSVGDNDNYFDPGESLTCTATYTVILADLTAGSVTNTASATADGVTSNTDSETVFRSIADLIVTKTNNVGGTVATGNSFDWTITVNNTGVAAAAFTGGNVILTDSLPGIAGYYPQGALTVNNGAIIPIGTINCSISGTTLNCTASGLLVTLPVGGSFSVTFTVTPAAAGSLANTVTVDPNNNILELNETNNSSTDTVTVGAPNLVIAKSNGGSFITAGGTTTYTAIVGNTGDTASVGLITVVDVLPTGLSIADGAVTLGGANAADWTCNASSNVITCTSTTAIPGNNGFSLFSFTLNVDPNASGMLTNRIQVGGGGDPTNPNPPTSTTVGQCTGTGIPNEGCYVDTDTVNAVNLGLAKSNGTTTVTPGGTTTYTQTVTNSGNTATSGTITVVDVLPTGLSIPDGAVTEGGVNAADWTCTALSNIITCTSGTSISGSGGVSVFNFTVNVDVSASGTVINRAQVGGGGDPTNPNPPTSVTAGQCTGTDVPNEGCATDSDTVDAQPALALTKTANPTSVTATGDMVTYTFSVENTGNVTLTNITLSDTLLSGLSCTPIVSLAPGASQAFVCTGNAYTVTQTDIDNNGGGDGDIDNTATATGTTPSGGSVSDTDSEEVTLPAHNPSLLLIKSASPMSVTSAGDIVTYTFAVQNTGNVTLTNLTLSDTLLSGLSCTVIASLAPSASQFFTCSGNTYVVTQADIDNNGGGDGDIDNTATAAGTAPSGGSVNDADAAAVAIIRTLAHTTLKAETSAGPYAVGDTLAYNIIVTNSGNVTLTGVSAVDNSATVGTCTPIQPATLAPGAALTCPASHVVTQADVDSGSYVNTATGDSIETPASTSTVTVNFTQNPSLNIIKEVSTDNATWVNSVSVTTGDTVYFRARVSNTGNVTLTGLTVTDPMCALARGADITGDNDGNFEVGEEWLYTCSVSAIAGTNNNTATADTIETSQDTDDASYTGNAIPAPAMNVSKDGTLDMTVVAPNGQVNAGDVINYTVSVQNTGNIALTGVSVSDPLLSDLDCDGAAGVPLTTTGLTINIGTTLTCTGSYTITQSDLDTNGGGDGDIDNTATADSLETGPDSDLNEESLPLAPAIDVTKTLNSATFNSPNEVRLAYTITVQNTGNVALSNLQVTDDLVTAFPGAASFNVFSVSSVDFSLNLAFNGSTDMNLLTGTDSLAAGASGTISLIVDVDTGGDEDFYINTAVGSGNAPNGTTVQDTGVASAPGFVDPALTKVASVAQASVGDIVTFTITVTNAGNAPAPNVVVTDTLPAMFDVTAVNVSVAGPALVPVVNVVPAIGVGLAPYTVTVNIGTLQVTNVVTIQVVTVVNSLGNPPVVNSAGLTTTAPTNNLLNDNASVTIMLGIGPTTSLSLPSTGFAPDIVTALPAQPKESLYAATDVMLEIPRLGVKMPIVGVPFKKGGWDVSWLGNQAGWLEGSAFPSWSGNSVLTGHVYSANGLPGPFLNLGTLKYGDQIIVYANGQKYIFEIRSNAVVSPTDASAFRHEELSWLTLITCKEYDPVTNTYKKRLVVRAILTAVE